MSEEYSHKSNSGKFLSFLAGVVVGGLSGAGIALLKAPQSGKKTRQQIQQTTEELRNQAQDVVSTTKEHGKQAADQISSHAQEIKKEAREAAERVRAEGKAAAQETKEAVREGSQKARQEMQS
jgi:gas vesicle protein